MHSIQYTALARIADNEGCDIVATHTLPGAAEHSDGVYAVFAKTSKTTPVPVTRYAVTSWWLYTPAYAKHLGWHDRELQTNLIQEHAADLGNGDRVWTNHERAMRDLADRVQMDSTDLEG